MRLAGLERVLGRRSGLLMIDLEDDEWTSASRLERWYDQGEKLAREYQEIEEGVLVDQAGNIHFLPNRGYQ